MKVRMAKNLSLGAVCAVLVVLAGCRDASGGSGGSAAPTNVLYIQTNNPASGQNAVIAYKRDATTGALTMLGMYRTGGTGYFNDDQRLGPDDSDQEIVASSNHKLLFAVNQGSNDISVFRIRANGRLRRTGAPTSSFGIQPASLVLTGRNLYVANRGDGILPTQANPAGQTGTPGATNYTGFKVRGRGKLSHIAGSTVVLADGSSPSQVIAAIGGGSVFGNNFFVPDSTVTPPAPIFPKARSYLDPLAIGSRGALALDTPVTLPSPTYDGAPYLLGLMTHPSQRILYTGVVGVGVVAVWTYDATGALTFSGQEEDPNKIGAAGGLCWIALSPNAKFMYASSVVPDVISVLSIGSDPTVVTRLQDFTLDGPKDPLPAGLPEPYKFTTAPFNLQVDPSGSFLYVLNNQTCTSTAVDPQCVNGTAIHTLAIAPDGTVTEAAGSPLVVSTAVMGAQGGMVPYHATGMVVF
ncbi:MAG TPA: beta-propeller fold lactonase family protein [Candidatus Binataceae bacterium]|nr:beta-propeller fold lactonase family protein [Candidatus Binataceae bacterium]